MKQLLVIRHAKSSWELSNLNDFDRPLNERGKRDAPVMARRLLDKKVKIDAFISSPAKRAKQTANLFAKEYEKKEEDIIFKTELYHAGEEVFYDVIEKTDDQLNRIAIFSHNPGITEFVNSLTEEQLDNMPTCGVFAIKIKTNKWADIKQAKKEFWFFDYPKSKDK